MVWLLDTVRRLASVINASAFYSLLFDSQSDLISFHLWRQGQRSSMAGCKEGSKWRIENMKIQKTNGKAGFSLCIAVASYVSHLLGKGWKEANMVQAVESWYNDKSQVVTEVKYGSATDRPKAGYIQGSETHSVKFQQQRSVVGQFVCWHDKIESASDRLTKLGCQVTVTALPEACQFEEWLHGFEAVKPAKSPKGAKNGKGAKVSVEAVKGNTPKVDLAGAASATAVA